MLRIKEIVKEKGLTQKDLAERLGISDISFNKTLRGKYPQLQTLERIADALDVDIVELFAPKASDDFIAMINYKGTMKQFNTIEELEEFITVIKNDAAAK